jgi:hypothetical protein
MCTKAARMWIRGRSWCGYGYLHQEAEQGWQADITRGSKPDVMTQLQMKAWH